MNSFFTKNISLFKKKFRSATLLADLALDGNSGGSSVEIIESKNGEPVPSVTRNGHKIPVHSRFDPRTEALRFAAEISAEHDLYIVFGLGFAYHIEALLAKIPPASNMLVIEKETVMLKAVLTHRDLGALLEDGRFNILIDPSEDELAETLKGKSSLKVSFITHRGSHQINEEYYASMLELCRSYLSTKEVNIATLAKFEKVWSANIARNIIPFIKSAAIKNFYGKFAKIPAIIAAAGPSLRESFDFIRENSHKAVIIAVDTAMPTLVKAGIQPHFCVAVDPQLVNARYFEGLPKLNTILVADPTVHPSVFHLYKGPVSVTGIAFDIMKWIENICGEKGEITHGGSVSTNAFDLAQRLSCSPIILVGQDLSFTGGRAHAKGSYMEEQVFLKTNRLANAEMHNRKQITSTPRIITKGIRSPKVVTNQKMMIFMSWFQKQKTENLINATFDGLLIPGVKHSPAQLLVLENNDTGIKKTIEEILASPSDAHTTTEETVKKLKANINKMFDEIISLIPQLEQAKRLSANLTALFESKKTDAGKVGYIFKKLDEIDRILESKENVKGILSMVSQKAIHTINEGYSIDKSDDELSRELLAAKRSNYLYSELHEGCLFNKKALTTMLRCIEKIV
ncbi:MAG: DUF115 domain-containing protein [Leptospirales bacterium]|nr:DUF115 domain-containing protein [Leptospirales bacterium]